MPTYEVTCVFAGPGCGTLAGAIDRLLATTASMREEGVDIAQRRITIDADRGGADPAMSARFAAPSEGIVGWHAYRARLPVSGIRRLERDDR